MSEETAFESFEREAAEFYRVTDYLPPGKDDVRDIPYEERQLAWRIWGLAKKHFQSENTALRQKVEELEKEKKEHADIFHHMEYRLTTEIGALKDELASVKRDLDDENEVSIRCYKKIQSLEAKLEEKEKELESLKNEKSEFIGDSYKHLAELAKAKAELERWRDKALDAENHPVVKLLIAEKERLKEVLAFIDSQLSRMIPGTNTKWIREALMVLITKIREIK